jgi:hypothetical protein
MVEIDDNDNHPPRRTLAANASHILERTDGSDNFFNNEDDVPPPLEDIDESDDEDDDEDGEEPEESDEAELSMF